MEDEGWEYMHQGDLEEVNQVMRRMELQIRHGRKHWNKIVIKGNIHSTLSPCVCSDLLTEMCVVTSRCFLQPLSLCVIDACLPGEWMPTEPYLEAAQSLS